MNTANVQRGEAVRRAILAVARQAHAKGLPMPPRRRLVEVLGVCRAQVWRHWARLIDEGAIVLSDKRTRHSRIYIKEVRP
jgi:hypothetical protein